MESIKDYDDEGMLKMQTSNNCFDKSMSNSVSKTFFETGVYTMNEAIGQLDSVACKYSLFHVRAAVIGSWRFFSAKLSVVKVFLI